MPESCTLPAFADLRANAVTSKLIGTDKHNGMIRGFHHLKEAWYGDATIKAEGTRNLVDTVSIGFFGPDGESGTTGEFCIQWLMLEGVSYPQLQVFGDAWEALSHFSDLLTAMADIKDDRLSPYRFCDLLRRLGIKDLTRRAKL